LGALELRLSGRQIPQVIGIVITGSIWTTTTPTAARLSQPENPKNKSCERRLPTAAEFFPELVNPKLDRKDKLPSCSGFEALERQEPFVNQTLAYPALAMLARLFRHRRLSYYGGFVNLRNGRTTSPSA
jgi:hypothetical protein